MCVFLLNTEFCVFATPTSQGKCLPLASALFKPNTALCTEMILLVEIKI